MDNRLSVPISEAAEDFSRVARLADENGTVIIMKDDMPRYMLVELRQAETERGSSTCKHAGDDEVSGISKRLIARNRKVYEELAKWRGAPAGEHAQ